MYFCQSSAYLLIRFLENTIYFSTVLSRVVKRNGVDSALSRLELLSQNKIKFQPRSEISSTPFQHLLITRNPLFQTLNTSPSFSSGFSVNLINISISFPLNFFSQSVLKSHGLLVTICDSWT